MAYHLHRPSADTTLKRNVCRDVKPENIVLEGGKAGGRVFLVDFGGVQAAALDQDFGSTIIGKKLVLQAGLHPMLACVSQYPCPGEPCSSSKYNSRNRMPPATLQPAAAPQKQTVAFCLLRGFAGGCE